MFWEGHNILRNLHQLFEWQYIGQIIGGDFAKSDVTTISFTTKNRIFTPFWYQNCKNCNVVLPIRIRIWLKCSWNLLMCLLKFVGYQTSIKFSRLQKMKISHIRLVWKQEWPASPSILGLKRIRVYFKKQLKLLAVKQYVIHKKNKCYKCNCILYLLSSKGL